MSVDQLLIKSFDHITFNHKTRSLSVLSETMVELLVGAFDPGHSFIMLEWLNQARSSSDFHLVVCRVTEEYDTGGAQRYPDWYVMVTWGICHGCESENNGIRCYS